MKLVDLSDERRDKKPWLPSDDQDVTRGDVILVEYDCGSYPACRLHGAMLRMSQHELVYRCGELRCGLGGQLVDEEET